VLVLDAGDPVRLVPDLLAARAAGHDVRVARDTVEALRAVTSPAAWRPDAVVFGHGWSGPWPVAGLVRAALGLGDVPVVRLDGDLSAAVAAHRGGSTRPRTGQRK
jgi:hypothetical protein